MANTVQLKRSSVAGKIPDAANVAIGEPVVNLADQIIFTKDGSGTVKVIGAGKIGNLSDVSNSSPSFGQVLAWNGSLWAPADSSGTGGSGTTANTVLGVMVQDAFTANGTGTTYVLSALASNANAIIVFVDSVLQEPITNYSVSGNILTFTSAPLTNANIDVRFFRQDAFNLALGELNNVSNANPTTNDVLTWTGSQWEPQAVTSGVSSVAGAEGAVSNVQLAAGITQSGILTTANVSEVTNLYYTDARVYSNVVTGGFATQSFVTTTVGSAFDAANVAQTTAEAAFDVANAAVVSADLTTANVVEDTNLYYTDARVQANVTTFLTTAPNVDVGGNLTVSGTLNTPDFGVSDTLTIGSQVIYAQGNNGFSVNEDFDPSANALQTAYHFTSGAGRSSVAFTLARTGQFTDGFGIYGTAADNKLVNFGEQTNTSFEWRKGVGIQPLNLSGGTLLANLSSIGNFYVTGNVHSPFLIGNVTGSASTVSSISNFTTTNLTEGTNLYYTDARVYSNVTQIGYATTTYVDNEVANLVASAPTTLDTLNELAAALGDDPNFATTTATLIGQSYDQANAAYAAANTKVVSADLTTANVTELTNLYYTDARVYSNVTQLGYITSSSLNGYATNSQLADYATVTDLGSAFDAANTAQTTAEAAFAVANAAVVSADLTTANVTEDTNLYYTDARVYSNVTQLGYITSSSLSGYATNSQLSDYATVVSVGVVFDAANTAQTTAENAFDAANAAGSSETVTAAFDKANTAYTVATSAYDVANAAVVSEDLTTANVTELTNLYYTDARVYSNVSLATVSTLADVSSNVPVAGQALVWDSNVNLWAPGNVAATSSGTSTLALYARYEYTATADQTTFTGNDDNSSYLNIPNPNYVEVYLNGVRLVPTSDYTANTTHVVLVEGASENDAVSIIRFVDAAADFTSDQFTGDGSNTTFTLSSTPSNESSILVSFNGVRQHTTEYTVSGTTLTFDVAPDVGESIEVVHLGASQAQSSAGATWIEVNTSTTLSTLYKYMVDTSGGSITLTLPASPSLGDTICILDGTGSFDTSNVLVSRNSNKIMGQTEDLYLDVADSYTELVYYNATYGWRVIS